MIDKLKTVTVVLLLSAANAVAGDYRARNNDEIEVFAAVLKSEISANNWTDKDLICFQIRGKDPSRKLVDALRRLELNVCSEAEWRRKLACEFSVWLAPVTFDSGEEARIRFQSSDLREVNSGEVHFVNVLRAGEYSLTKTGERWSIGRYVPEKATR
jgi:hypothetical protein